MPFQMWISWLFPSVRWAGGCCCGVGVGVFWRRAALNGPKCFTRSVRQEDPIFTRRVKAVQAGAVSVCSCVPVPLCRLACPPPARSPRASSHHPRARASTRRSSRRASRSGWKLRRLGPAAMSRAASRATATSCVAAWPSRRRRRAAMGRTTARFETSLSVRGHCLHCQITLGPARTHTLLAVRHMCTFSRALP